MQPHSSELLTKAIQAAKQYGRFYCKFITANDVGLTNAHQEGLHIAKGAWKIFFEEEGVRGENKDKHIKIHIEGFYPFESRVIYYGKGTRNEYRITRFWSNSPYEKENQVGNLIIFIPVDMENIKVYIFDTEVEIENFKETFSLSLLNNNAVYFTGEKLDVDLSKKLELRINKSATIFEDFPKTIELAELARQLNKDLFERKGYQLGNDPDKMLLKWIETEYSLFRAIEKNIYKSYLNEPFYELDSLLEFASSALNRRKSRAGRSLEHHIEFILSNTNIPFSHPGKTEGKKKPDFLLPSNSKYADKLYDSNKLVFLGAKTTCKDRWRQILNEANRIPIKHLLTLQQGITINQLEEMQDEQVILVVPKPYHKAYPQTHRERLWTVSKFIKYAREKYID
ncbi:type II restriction endonuclease [Alkalihalophilus pseudofirmus]|uniref:type II restriction endonuclease n=1 Tax=Alkalihalophilus pseudofirmus TaxID=79885 RepID=UPI00259AEDDE|nr:type II restriction endonuclease [Alkalihalophilus pseudofirmus]WEG18933.1 type II restriction endonuclease [Alkalihalophilus pseudofirmus]